MCVNQYHVFIQIYPLKLNDVPLTYPRYYLVRAGESEWEQVGLIHTNPVDKTNVQSGLSPMGQRQAVRAAFRLKDAGACDLTCWIWPSISQRSYQTAEIIARVNDLGYR